jgi:hypothetical protein
VVWASPSVAKHQNHPGEHDQGPVTCPTTLQAFAVMTVQHQDMFVTLVTWRQRLPSLVRATFSNASLVVYE